MSDSIVLPIASEALLKACRLVGSQVELAKCLEIHRSRLNNWLNRDTCIPYHYILKIEQITQGKVGVEELSPFISQLNALSKQRFQNKVYEELVQTRNAVTNLFEDLLEGSLFLSE